MKRRTLILTSTLLLVTAAPAAAAPPTVTAETQYTSNQHTVRDPIQFTAKGTDPEGGELTYAWTLSDGTTADGATFTRTYDTAGERSATVTATDPDGETATATVVVKVVSFDGWRMGVTVTNATTTQNVNPYPTAPLPAAPAPRQIAPLTASLGAVPAKPAKDGKVRVPITVTSADGNATIALTLRTAKPVKVTAKARAKVLKLAATSGSVAVGQQTATLKLKPADLRLVKRLRRLPVVFEGTVTDGAGQTQALSRKVTLTAAR